MSRRTKRASLACLLLVLAVAAGAVLAAPSAVADSVTCQAKNERTGVKSKGASALESAIADAAAGDSIGVWGTCYGNYTIDKNLTLRGQSDSATLDGNRQGRVLRIRAGTTALRDLTIRGGKTSSVGGGIYVGSAAALTNVRVVGNEAGATQFGGGIEADLGSSLTLVDSMVTGNTAGSSGGIDMFRATATLIRSTVKGNHATREPGAEPDGCGFGTPTVVYACAGGIWNYQGTLALVDSRVSGNTAAFRGGGLASYVRVVEGQIVSGITILSGKTSISGNAAGDQGGGIWANDAASVEAADGTDVYTDPISGATLPAWRGSISGNAPDQCSPTITLGGTTCGS